MKKNTLLTALAVAVTTITLASTVASAVPLFPEEELDLVHLPSLKTRLENADWNYEKGVWDVKAQQIINKIGWAKFKEIYLDKGDVANWNFDNIDTFVNLVDGKVQIDGIMNSVRNGKAYNGNAIFIAKGGFAVGASGVINVGSLGVQAPDININGKVFAQNGIDLQGKNVNVNGALINGVKGEQVLTSKAQADALFDKLVSLDGKYLKGAQIKMNIKTGEIVKDPQSDIKITTENGFKSGANSYMVNHYGDVVLQNNGNRGMELNGKVSALNVKLENNAGNLKATRTASLYANKDIDITNNGGNLWLDDAKIGYGATFTSADGKIQEQLIPNSKNVRITNNGAGILNTTADIYAKNISITGSKGTYSAVGGSLNGDNIQIANQNSNMFVGADMKAKDVNIHQENGDLYLDSKVNLESDGDFNATVDENGNLAVGTDFDVKFNGNSNVRIKKIEERTPAPIPQEENILEEDPTEKTVQPKAMGLLDEPKAMGLLDEPKYTIAPKEVKPVAVQPRKYQSFELDKKAELKYTIEPQIPISSKGIAKYENFTLDAKDVLDK